MIQNLYYQYINSLSIIWSAYSFFGPEGSLVHQIKSKTKQNNIKQNNDKYYY